jgi:glycosyltransferase involved in cell wall biosynthesis
MRVLILSKRQYMGKDLLDDAYGRFYELPLELARLGHEVRGICASYRSRREGDSQARREGVEVSWQARNVRPFSPLSIHRWVRSVKTAVQAFRPELIWACSDSFHAIVGAHAQRRWGVPCVIDLYDNFESYPASRLPGVRPLFRSAVRRAAGVTCVSGALERYVRRTCRPGGNTSVLENGVTPEFRPLDRAACRRRFGLPASAAIVGTAGALDASRDIDTLFEAFLRLAERRRDLHLVLAGRIGRSTRIPSHERILYLGQRPVSDIPSVIGAMDLTVICNKRSAFGEYCFPQKLYETLACGVPPLVADTSGVAQALEASPGNRYEPGSAISLAEGIERLLANTAFPAIRAKSWSEHGVALSTFLETVAQARRRAE